MEDRILETSVGEVKAMWDRYTQLDRDDALNGSLRGIQHLEEGRPRTCDEWGSIQDLVSNGADPLDFAKTPNGENPYYGRPETTEMLRGISNQLFYNC